MKLISDPAVKDVFNAYPGAVKSRMLRLRKLVLETAAKTEGVGILEETLKWGEPSYLTKHGSTLRMDWKPGTPDQYALYFKCTSKLVPTFREVYGDLLRFETDRAIVFGLNETIPEEIVRNCIGTALRYHRLKGMDHLGLTLLS